MSFLSAAIQKDSEIQQIIEIRELSNDEEDILNQALKELADLECLINTKYSLEQNFSELIAYTNYLNKNQSLIIQSNLHISEKMQGIIQETNRLVLNVLFSLTATVEHFKHILKRTDVAEYELMLNNLFDTCPEYAFIYKLRNFSQHQCLPISNIHISESIEEPSKINVFLDKALLLNYNSWGKIVKPYLEKQDDVFEITNILISAITNLDKNIFLYWINNYIEKTDKDFEKVTNFIKEIMFYCEKQNCKAVYPMILERIVPTQTYEKGLQLKFRHFPLKFLQRIGIINIAK